MAYRCNSLAKPAFSLIRSTITKPSLKPKCTASLLTNASSTSTILRSAPRLGCLQSLLPLHSAVASARLTSCLGIDSCNSKALSQESGLSVPR